MPKIFANSSGSTRTSTPDALMASAIAAAAAAAAPAAISLPPDSNLVPRLCRLYPRCLLQPPRLNLLVPNLELLNLPRHRHRKRLHEPYVLRNLEMRDLPLAILANLFFARHFLQPYPGTHRLPQLHVRS